MLGDDTAPRLRLYDAVTCRNHLRNSDDALWCCYMSLIPSEHWNTAPTNPRDSGVLFLSGLSPQTESLHCFGYVSRGGK
jgi:hypothetical protein